MPAIVAPQLPLTDGVISLRPAAARDIPDVLIAYQDDPELHLRLGEERPPSGAELGRTAERAPRALAEGTGVTFTITEPDEEACRGQVAVHHIDWPHRRAELGLWLAPRFRGRGWAPRALRLVGGWLLSGCGFGRVAILSQPDNHAMLTAARAAGFQAEGVLREYVLEHGHRFDRALLSLVSGDLRPPGGAGAR